MQLVRVILFFIGIFFLSTAFAENAVRVVYDAPLNAAETATVKALKASGVTESVVVLMNETFSFPRQLDIVFGGEEGPLYDSDTNQILIPYSFVEEIKSRFAVAKYAETGVSPEEAAQDALMHTLFHELAHALISLHELPVLGKEEDAADALAAVLLIECFEEGQEIAISAADLFDLESEEIDEFEEQDFWDEHSLDVQRYYSTLCHVYGSDPEKYAHLKDDGVIGEERAELCIEEYEQVSKGWMSLLSPYMIKDNEET